MSNPEPGGLLLGRYRLRSLLGSGSSAQVWLATDERLGRSVALKILHGHLLPDRASRERFVTEARAAAGVRHPGIVGVYDVVSDESITAIVFEHVEGESLEQRLRRPPEPTPEEAALVVAELAEALAAAHRAGIVHRDVKPANVLLARTDGIARLVDFGIARILEPEVARLTRTGEIVGTLETMAPEQLAGREVGAAADIYALGSLLYQLLARRAPFNATTPAGLAELQRRPPPPIPGAPPALAGLAFRMLRPEPDRRPATADEVAAFLRGWLEAGSVPATASPAGGGRVGSPGPGRGDRGVGRHEAPTIAGGPISTGVSRSRWAHLAVPALIASVAAIAVLGIVGQSLLAGGLRPGTSPSPALGTVATSPPATPASEASGPADSSPLDSPSPSPSPSPTPTPTASPTPTPEPLPTELSIESPADGSVTDVRLVTVVGLAPPGSVVTRDVPMAPDDHATVDASGHWQIPVALDPGKNILTFRLGDDRSTELTIDVTYEAPS